MLERQRLVKAVRIGPIFRVLAQMPFANLQGAVAVLLEQPSQRDLAGRQAHFFVVNQIGLPIGMVDRMAQITRDPVIADHFHELHRRGRELITKPCRVASGHQGGPARCAGRIASVASLKVHPIQGNAVDMGGGHAAVGNAATLQGDVVEPQVVGDDQDDVGFFPAIKACNRAWAGLPVHLLIGRCLGAHHVFDIQQQDLGFVQGCIPEQGADQACGEGDIT